MAEAKTKPTRASVETFLNGIPDEQQRADARKIVRVMKQITGEKPKMWGPSIIGLGKFHYVYASGREGDTPLIGFSPRKSAFALYFCAGLEQRFAVELKMLGKFKMGKGCLYIKKLADIDLDVLSGMLKANVAYLRGMAKADV